MRHTKHPYLLALAVFSFLSLTSVSPAPAGAGRPRETPIVLAVRKAKPAVVNITSEKTVLGRGTWDREPIEPQRVNGMGSGVIIDERGYIMTNAHVVDRVSSLRVRLADGSAYEASVVDRDRVTDLAMLKIEAGKPLPTIPMGTSSDLMVGETVIAIGNAYGYENTMTAGYISALGRTVRLNDEITYYDLIQTNADINPGNSGGALLNIDGDLVGINVAIRAGAQGISFAIPVNTMRRVAAELLSIRRVNHTWHGMQFDETTDPKTNQTELVVQKVEGPSQRGGFRAGDKIVQIDSSRIRNALEFERSLLGLRAGERTSVVVRRGAVEETLELAIEDLPKTAESPTEVVWRRLGLRLSKIEPTQVKQYQDHLKGGMYVSQVQPGSPAAAAGIRAGDVLLGLATFETLSYENIVFILTEQVKDSYDPIEAHVLRSGVWHKLQIRLAAPKRVESREARAASQKQ